MPFSNRIYSKLDPDRLVPAKSWWRIGLLVSFILLLFAFTLIGMVSDEHAIGRSFESGAQMIHTPALQNEPNGYSHQLLEKTIAQARSSVRRSILLLLLICGLFSVLLIYGHRLTVRRLTRDRRAYHALLDEQKKVAAFTRDLIDLSPVGYHSINKDGVFIEMNKTELDWLGYERAEVIGKKHYTDMMVKKDRIHFKGVFEAFQQQGQVNGFEVNLVSKNGDVFPALFSAKAIYDEKGHFLHSIATTYNFTVRKKLENALVVARREADNANRLKQQFMANMSHEIRTPLNAVLGFSHLLGRANLPENLQEYVQSIQIAGNNLLVIVNDILDYEKIRSGLLRIEHIEFDLPGLLHSVFTMMRPAAEEKNLTMLLVPNPEIPDLLMGDPMRLTQVLVNLLGNAVKFTEKGLVTLRVSVIKDRDTAGAVRIRFDVEDSGIGIPESERTRIFERFAQASSDTTRKYGGTGLGLSLVKMLVELQHGSVTLVSETGRGSTFTIEIPYKTVKKSASKKAIAASGSEALPNFKGSRILLVEDNLFNSRIADLYLSELGIKVTLASNGAEAVKQLRANPDGFDLVFMDIQMPEMDGYTATRIIRTEIGLNALPIIAMTAHVLAGERENIRANGLNDYLSKPINHKDLLTTLQRYLGAAAVS